MANLPDTAESEKPRGLFRRLVGLFLPLPGYHYAFGVLFPPDARVDPTLFPEEDYSLICPHCRYHLRGLPEPICPECGTPYDRGRLLVEQYVLRIPEDETSRYLSTWGFAFAALLYMGVSHLPDRYNVIGKGMPCLANLLLISLSLLPIFWRRKARPDKFKQLAVLQAIDPTTESFQAAQREKRGRYRMTALAIMVINIVSTASLYFNYPYLLGTLIVFTLFSISAILLWFSPAIHNFIYREYQDQLYREHSPS